MDYYAILGVARTASQEEIKKAYRNLAKQYHPDVNPGDTQAEAKFKEASEAYEALSDEQKRANYDQFGNTTGPTGFGGGGFGGFDPFSGFGDGSIFEEFFGRPKAHVGNTDINLSVDIALKDFVLGGKVKISFQRVIFCGTCNGQGGTDVSTCQQCNGKGSQVMSVQNGPFIVQQAIQCNSCQGKDKTVKNVCQDCVGVGNKNNLETIDIEIQKNCPLLATLQIANYGNQEKINHMPGSLFVKLNPILTPDLNCRNDGDVISLKEISMEDWYNNSTVNINRFGIEDISYDLSNLRSSNQAVTFAGKGVNSANNNRIGNLVVEFRINK